MLGTPVHYIPTDEERDALCDEYAAIIVKVWKNKMVNLFVMKENKHVGFKPDVMQQDSADKSGRGTWHLPTACPFPNTEGADLVPGPPDADAVENHPLVSDVGNA